MSIEKAFGKFRGRGQIFDELLEEAIRIENMSLEQAEENFLLNNGWEKVTEYNWWHPHLSGQVCPFGSYGEAWFHGGQTATRDQAVYITKGWVTARDLPKDVKEMIKKSEAHCPTAS